MKRFAVVFAILVVSAMATVAHAERDNIGGVGSTSIGHPGRTYVITPDERDNIGGVGTTGGMLPW